ncbi:MAG TPA: response regulator transcription factor, partial [Actinobacteria bacterium]|nr:response regulator transcription factor [Actinomycetota bacterium]
MIDVAIADDHRLFADGLAEALGGLPDIRVVGVAYDGTQLMAVLDRQPADVAIIDLEMPTMGGIQVLETIGSR